MLYLRRRRIIFLEINVFVKHLSCPDSWYLTSVTVYIYRTVLDSINGVSSSRHTSFAAVTLQEGEIRQLQFVEDDTLMVLWSNSSMYCLHALSMGSSC